MNSNLRADCYELPTERVLTLFWCRAQQPTTWRLLWARIVRGWRQ